MQVRAALVFDLDGTISDPLAGIARSMNAALESQGLATVGHDVVAKLVGPPLDAAFRTLVPGAADGLVTSLVANYRETYADGGYAENRIYPGVPEALRALDDGGVRLGVCTSKRSDFAELILEHFGIRDVFAFVDGGDVGIAKGQQLARLLTADLIDRKSLMIGDRAADIDAARANGLGSVGVLWGYGSAAELEAAGADRLLSRTAELATLAHRSRKQSSARPERW